MPDSEKVICPFKRDYTSPYFRSIKYKSCNLQYLGAKVFGKCVGEDKCPIMK